MSLFGVLKEGPSGDIIDNTLKDYFANDITQALTLEDKLIIIKYLIPLTPTFQINTLNYIFRLFNNDSLLLSQLVRFTSELEPCRKERLLYEEFLIKYISKNPSILYHYITSLPLKHNMLQKNIIKAMFFGSQIYNVLYKTESDFTIFQYIEILVDHWEHIFEKLNDDKDFKFWNILADFLSRCFSFHPKYVPSSMVDHIFFKHSSNFQVLLKILSEGSLLERSKIIGTYILPHLELKCSSQNYNTIYKIIKRIFDLDNQHLPINLEVLLSFKSLYFQEILIRSIANNKNKKLEVLGDLLEHFEDISNNSDSFDEEVINDKDDRISKILFIALKYNFSKEERFELSQNEKFLNCVTSRLQNRNTAIRERTMFLAKYLTANELKYESNYRIDIPDLVLLNDITEINFSVLFNSNTGNKRKLQTNEVTKISTEVDILSLEDSDDEDSDDEDEDENNNKGKHRKYIVFLKDLLKEYIELNQNQRNDLVSLLKRTVKLVRQKRLLPLEVSYYAEELMQNIVILNNNFEEKNFEQWRIMALISLIVVVPDKIDGLFKILFNSELSLQQRMSILSSIGLASRELRGIDDKEVLKAEYDFPSKRLPWDNRDVKNTSKKIDDITNMENDQNNLISSSTVTWRSKKLDIISGKQMLKKKNEFRKHASKFFYPLANGWLNGINLGSYDKIFKAHYMATLRIVYSCADPIHNYELMTQMIEIIINQAIEQKIPIDV